MRNTIELDFADGSYTFALPLPRIDELQRKTSIGIGGLFARVIKGCAQIGSDVVMVPASAEFYAIDLIETIRQGLIGGNHAIVDGQEIKVSPALAERLIQNYGDYATRRPALREPGVVPRTSNGNSDLVDRAMVMVAAHVTQSIGF